VAIISGCDAWQLAEHALDDIGAPIDRFDRACMGFRRVAVDVPGLTRRVNRAWKLAPVSLEEGAIGYGDFRVL
jgi:hypothetical protein